MKKIPTLFVRDLDNPRLVTRVVTEGCEWVFDGVGEATRKMDGECCMFRGGDLFKRRELKKAIGQQAALPFGFEQVDETDTKLIGWVPVVSSDPADKWFMEALHNQGPRVDGTYELLGPKVQGNPEAWATHEFYRHGSRVLHPDDVDFDGLKHYFEFNNIEGIVFHASNGRMMSKIKARDFGVVRK